MFINTTPIHIQQQPNYGGKVYQTTPGKNQQFNDQNLQPYKVQLENIDREQKLNTFNREIKDWILTDLVI